LLAALAIAIATSSFALDAARGAPSDAASEEVAAKRFDEGERAFARGDYVKAGEAFDAAYEAKPHEAALWNAARSWERAGEIARAANLYRKYLRTAPDDAPDRRRATTALDALAPKVARLEIVAPSLHLIRVDGRAVDDAVVYVVPGTHLVEGSADAAAAGVKREIGAAAGAIVSVVLDPPPAAPASESVPSSSPPLAASSSAPPVPSSSAPPVRPLPPPPEPKRHGVTPWLLTPFVAATAISGTFLIASGIDVLRAKSDYEDLKKGRSAEEQQQLIDEGVGKTDRTNVLIGVTGGLALVTGIVALTAIDWGGHDKPGAPPKASASVRVGPGGAWILGRF
jgi:tetratricopeptide (TPR) repeat protein